MPTRPLLSILFGLAIVVTMSGCSGDEKERSPVPAKVTGVLTDIESEGIGEVRGFTLKDGDDMYEILIDPEIEYGFDLGHLQEHLSGSLPVTVELEERDGSLYAQTIEDA